MLKDLYDRAKRALTPKPEPVDPTMVDYTHSAPTPTLYARRIPNGPFKGRVYEVRPDGGLGRRLA
jgi:hypothetical protein